MRGPTSTRFKSLRRGSWRARLARAVLEGVVLQVALAGLVADGAVERMIDQEQLEHALPRLRDLGPRVSTTMPSRTGVLQEIVSFGIPSTFDHAHAAAAVDRELGMKAVVRNLDAVIEQRRQQHAAVGHLDRRAVDGDGAPSGSRLERAAAAVTSPVSNAGALVLDALLQLDASRRGPPAGAAGNRECRCRPE